METEPRLYKALTSDSKNHYHKHNIELNEHRAPTDESINIFNELQKKARQSCLGVYSISNNILSAEIAFFKIDNGYNPGIMGVDLRYAINSNTYRDSFEITMPPGQDDSQRFEYLLLKIKEYFVDKISNTLTIKGLEELETEINSM